eukprot:3677059-Rhodomonas_salina.2
MSTNDRDQESKVMLRLDIAASEVRWHGGGLGRVRSRSDHGHVPNVRLSMPTRKRIGDRKKETVLRRR